jgi:hypothetical protein
MDARLVARLLAICRVAIGAAFALAPAQAAPLWLGSAGRSRGARFFLRIVGTRDLVLAAGALMALARESSSARGWVLAGAAADACDLAATIASRDELPPLAAANAIAVTIGGVALGAAAATRLD